MAMRCPWHRENASFSRERKANSRENAANSRERELNSREREPNSRENAAYSRERKAPSRENAAFPGGGGERKEYSRELSPLVGFVRAAQPTLLANPCP
jgi:hypothetical protein